MISPQNFLQQYEYIAVWLEAIALIAIFIWDRVDAIRELEVARNSERAWLLTHLNWPDGEGGRVVLGTNKERDSTKETTTFSVVLTCRNEGGTPAWIEKVHGYVELVEGKLKDLPSPVGHSAQEFPSFGPIAPGDKDWLGLMLTCDGHLRHDQLASIFVLIEYRDVFKPGRVTTSGYTVSGRFLDRQVQLHNRNYHK